MANQLGGNALFGMGYYKQAEIAYNQLFNVMPPIWQVAQKQTEAYRIFWKDHPDFLNTLQNVVDSYLKTGQTKKAASIKAALIEIE
ncbi:hypothetical protein IPJ72_02690 [Candidatus Peregrinibacteria bacterium]|nr:MAG: hypothetical protein IPJ72_02690 [Candidatus Peregrinibacteria bacterium]